ncbi:MAG: DUF2254 domain-containing protein [Hyphomicrobiales bacterium]|nr:DUF2254 domain-containing protein [Hyphomicrobiales bacterium]
MLSKTAWIVRRLTRQLWFRASIFAALGVATALVAIFAQRYFDWTPPREIGADTVESILDILASSMLAVTTFSLNIMVSAYSSATSNVTPRATPLLREDKTTQNALGVFLGAFLFSLVGIVALGTGLYGDRGRLVLFIVTLGVIGLIVATILRWIDHLSGLGRVGETARLVEDATRDPLMTRAADPTLGARAFDLEAVPADAGKILCEVVGYVQHIDLDTLSNIAEAHALTVWIVAPPGAFVFSQTPLAYARADSGDVPDDDTRRAVARAFFIADQRTFDQDPRFGIIVLTEIASRALSPAVNDPGTAIGVIGRSARLLLGYANAPRDRTNDAAYPRLRIAPIDAGDLLSDAFAPIARDGASIVEVQIRLQKALAAIAQSRDPSFRAAACSEAQRALAHAESALVLDKDKETIRQLCKATLEGARRYSAACT